MTKLILKFAAKRVAKRIRKSATAAVAGGIGLTGIAAILKPEYLELIPESLRGYAVLAVGAAVLLARVRREIVEGIRDVREVRNGE